ncbi:MAG: hypothetical protein RL685_54 [Pseudomonadota bacterium]|jgi:hypothetical protein
MRVAAILCPLDEVPVDFLADPDGVWEFQALADAAGFEEAWGRISVGALTEPYRDFPEGAAVVLLDAPGECAISLVDCTARMDQGSRLEGGRGDTGIRTSIAA